MFLHLVLQRIGDVLESGLAIPGAALVSEMGAVAPVAGVPWTPGAIGNASWTGVSLAAVLRACGAEHHPSLHVAFACADTCELEGKRFNYGASIPIEKAMTQAVLLAWAMNGETLTPENGYPLRVVVPGYAGVRSPKWLTAFTVQDAPSDSPIQADDTSCSPGLDEADRRSRAWPDHQRHARQFRYLHAQAHAMLPSGPAAVSGYAVATMRPIVRVDVSADDGRRWCQAELQTDSSSPRAWTLWHTEIDLRQGDHVLAVRA